MRKVCGVDQLTSNEGLGVCGLKVASGTAGSWEQFGRAAEAFNGNTLTVARSHARDGTSLGQHVEVNRVHCLLLLRCWLVHEVNLNERSDAVGLSGHFEVHGRGVFRRRIDIRFGKTKTNSGRGTSGGVFVHVNTNIPHGSLRCGKHANGSRKTQLNHETQNHKRSEELHR